jgi:hypothetical protein
MRWFQGQSRVAEPSAAAGADDAAGDSQDRNRSRLGFPAAGRLVRVPGQGLGPGEQVGGEGDDLDPEPVLGVAGGREVPQAGVLEGADSVLGAGA